MAAITITAANVAWVSGPTLSDQIAGEAFTAGMAVYQADNGTWLKAQGDGTEAEAGDNNVGVALFTADAAGARGSIASTGAVVAYGAVLTKGLVYIVGDTAGSIYPSADAGSGDQMTILGLAISTSQLKLQRVYDDGAVLA
jgi:hypothetical protein